MRMEEVETRVGARAVERTVRGPLTPLGTTSARVAALLGLAALVSPSSLRAQAPALTLGGEEVVYEARILDRGIDAVAPLMPNHDGRYIVVHLAENRVFVFDGEEAIWSAPAGTGTGFRLESGEHSWDFATPRGMFKVRKMERDPRWEPPDWHWIEKGLTPPPIGSPARILNSGMGNTAIYLGDGIAIHGTERPEYILRDDPEARRVSHGCIRLTNESARELMHLVEVGTPVLVF